MLVQEKQISYFGGVAMNIGYESTHKQKCVAGSAFTVHNVSPCYLAEEREIVKKDIENKLFEIFYKYCQT